MSSFFIKRPIFTWVLALFIIGAGIIALPNLPIQPYPSVAPPEVSISAQYPGASATTLDKTVTQRIEQNLVAIEDLRYINSTSSSSGQTQIKLTFEIEADPEIAQVQTQNRLSQVISALPSQVQQLGIPVEKSSGFYSLVVALYSDDNSIGQIDIGDFVAANLVEPIGRVKGVGRINSFAPQHSLRIWLNPSKLYNYKMTILEVVSAVKDQNNQLASGQLGGSPSVKGQQINASIVSQSLFSSVEEFENIILKTLPDGSSVRLMDVARVEIGSENYNSLRRYIRKEASGFGISLASGANALETIRLVKEKLNELKSSFPDSLEIAYPVDASPFIEASIYEVVKTLIIATLLVILVMFVFLQNYKSTLVPAVAIPVVLLGTFASLYFLGYSINILTLFALVLAIGLLVDDAIVVTENIKRSMDEDPDLDAKESAQKSMKELAGALVGTTVVLWAVFTPMLFFSGSTGVIYKQFAVTLIIAMTFSLFVALTLTPSLCASLFKSKEKKKKEGRFFKVFNKNYDKMSEKYDKSVKWTLKNPLLGLVAYLGVAASTLFLFFLLPNAFLPDEDQGNAFALIEGPPNATFEQMLSPIKEVEDFFLSEELSGAIKDIFTIRGFSFSGSGQNAAIGFVHMKDFDQREGDITSVFEVAQMAQKKLSTVRDAKVTVITPPPIRELGNAKGFSFQLVDQKGLGRDELSKAKDKMIGALNSSDKIAYARINSLSSKPEFKIDIDYQKAKALGVSVQNINSTLGAAWGGQYVNDFVENNRVKRVFIQGDAPYRMNPQDLSFWYVKSSGGEMVSFSEFSKGQWDFGPPQVQRFNGDVAFPIQGEAGQGFSTGEAMEEIEVIAKETLPKGMGIEWTGLSYEERQSGNQVLFLYFLAIVAIFLSLAALYESWSIPVSIILMIPLGVFGAALFSWVGGQTNDVYFKVGVLLAMGLAAKNSILIIEFAIAALKNGADLKEASIEACKQRFRPILMTSFTFLLGVLPLVFAYGPGSGAQNSIGYSLVGGIISTTLLVIFFAPLFFVLVSQLTSQVKSKIGVKKNEA
jgi:multidrug efflux pump